MHEKSDKPLGAIQILREIFSMFEPRLLPCNGIYTVFFRKKAFCNEIPDHRALRNVKMVY